MLDNISPFSGEKLTFIKLFTEKNYSVEIPIIQRDYAQGRKGSSEIRNLFLDTLYDHLQTGKNIDLDFVYGSLKASDKTKFIPLDGQQRLTTLFLLHWYLANKDGSFQVFKDIISDEKGKSRFTYETRTSSREFCDALIKYDLDPNDLLGADVNKNNSLSKTLQNLNWYFLSWNSDPTIKSMLTMLDSIHERFAGTTGFFTKLIDTQNPVVTFQFLDLGVLQLTDDLYIKMNSRGKQLTPFENFKAKFEQFIKDANFNSRHSYTLKFGSTDKQVNVQEYFSHKIDTEWANLFWTYRDKATNLFDDQLMNFIRVIATNHYASEKEDKKLDKLKILLGKDPENKNEKAKPITFYQYAELESLDEKLVIDLISILDILSQNDGKLRCYLSGNTHFEEESIFEEVIDNSLNYKQRIKFFAFYGYLTTNGFSDGLTEWMRVIHNLAENTIYNSAVDFARSIKSVKSLLPFSSDILPYLAAHSNKDIRGFLDIQVAEEIIKAGLILKTDAWKNIILKAEAHPYFNGQIGFLISFSGIQTYYKNYNNCDWSDTENALFIFAFNEYAGKAAAVFGKGGVVDLPKHIWERALLSKGDYLLSKDRNYSFLINADRDISWKRLLRDGNAGKRKFVRELFDDPEFNSADLVNSLDNIITQADIQDWRRHFVKTPGILSCLGHKRYIRWNSPDSIYLLERQRMNGKHAEYYSYAYYLESLKGKQYLPFSKSWYNVVSGEDEKPCAIIDDWKFEKDSQYVIHIFYLSQQVFKVKFLNKKQKAIDTAVAAILESNGFKVEDNCFTASKASDELDGFIGSLCESFRKLVGLPDDIDDANDLGKSTPTTPSPSTGG